MVVAETLNHFMNHILTIDKVRIDKIMSEIAEYHTSHTEINRRKKPV